MQLVIYGDNNNLSNFILFHSRLFFVPEPGILSLLNEQSLLNFTMKVIFVCVCGGGGGGGRE